MSGAGLGGGYFCGYYLSVQVCGYFSGDKVLKTKTKQKCAQADKGSTNHDCTATLHYNSHPTGGEGEGVGELLLFNPTTCKSSQPQPLEQLAA